MYTSCAVPCETWQTWIAESQVVYQLTTFKIQMPDLTLSPLHPFAASWLRFSYQCPGLAVTSFMAVFPVTEANLGVSSKWCPFVLPLLVWYITWPTTRLAPRPTLQSCAQLSSRFKTFPDDVTVAPELICVLPVALYPRVSDLPDLVWE